MMRHLPGSERSSTPTGEHGFALLTVFWLGLIAFAIASILWIYLGTAHRAEAQRRASFRERLAIEEVVQAALLRSPNLRSLGALPDTLVIRAEANGQSYCVLAASWGLWGLMEVWRYDPTRTQVARRLIAGDPGDPKGVVLSIRHSRMPLVLADQADVEGIVSVPDTAITRPWKGRYYAGPVPSILRDAVPFSRDDYWTRAREYLDDVLLHPARGASFGAQIFAGPLDLDPQTFDAGGMFLVDGDVRLRGTWPTWPICIYATGDIDVLPGTTISGQFLAIGGVQISGAKIVWPSLIVAAGDGNAGSRPTVVLSGGSMVDGSVVVRTPDSLDRSENGQETGALMIGEGSVLRGSAVVYGAVRNHGVVEGHVDAAETVSWREPVTYHNWILDGRWALTRDPAKRPLLPLSLPGVRLMAIVVELLEQ